ncbi:MAG TPA: hypothetical protein VKK61_08650 [Tepidisphaeraceae bacterium]|nr:hypothetical protein [Tepidisphaeraceae bacterium]
MDPLIQILKRLNEQGVDFVLIDGMAAIVHGSSVVTQDINVCVSFSKENVSKIFAALLPLNSRIRSHPKKMLLSEVIERLDNLKNLYLSTDLGNIDLLGELPGVCSFEELRDKTVMLDIAQDLSCRVLDIDTLIAAKRVAARAKDKVTIHHLEAIKKRGQSNSK